MENKKENLKENLSQDSNVVRPQTILFVGIASLVGLYVLFAFLNITTVSMQTKLLSFFGFVILLVCAIFSYISDHLEQIYQIIDILAESSEPEKESEGGQ